MEIINEYNKKHGNGFDLLSASGMDYNYINELIKDPKRAGRKIVSAFIEGEPDSIYFEYAKEK
jgi:hypothetical protein